MISTATSAVLDLFFPPRCEACSGAVAAAPGEESLLCKPCAVELERLALEPACPRCGRGVAANEVDEEGACTDCRSSSLGCRRITRIGAYRGPLRRLIRELKFRGREAAAHGFTEMLAERVLAESWAAELEVVTFVPTHWTHRMRRPLHAAEVIANDVARKLHLPCVPLLRRLRGGRHQVGLSRRARLQNVRGSFGLSPAYELADTCVLLMDDVRTTGATLEECARILRGGGAMRVYAAVAAKVDLDEGRYEI